MLMCFLNFLIFNFYLNIKNKLLSMNTLKNNYTVVIVAKRAKSLAVLNLDLSSHFGLLMNKI